MKVGSLFSGYGGLDLAVGGDLAWYSEIEPAACKVMEAHYPGVPNLGDITQVDWAEVEAVDVITGGYPCQPFSNAGMRKGKDDERHLWPHVRDAISAIRPRRAVLENVRGHLTLGFDIVLTDLAALGLSARWGVVRAADAGAPHHRARLFIVTDAERPGLQGQPQRGVERSGKSAASGEITANANSAGSQARDHGRQGHGDARRPQLVECGEQVATNPSSERHGTAQRRGFSQSENERWLQQSEGRLAASWGDYAPAINRWERVIGRSAPAPTIQRNGRDRLNPVFVEWMMGLPEGWVTGHGLSASQELKMLGNGVVPQQAALALRLLGAA
jgi:DNA (cytosine-5)-methyltransferase 1